MLVLSRKRLESVIIGVAVGGKLGFRVTVVDVSGGKVRLGFDVDPAIPVHRSEVWERMQAGAAQPLVPTAPIRFGRAESPREMRGGLGGTGGAR